MARTKRTSARKTFLYFFINGTIHKVLKKSRAKDQLIAWSYADKKRVLFSYSLIEREMKQAYTLTEVCALLNKHKVTIEDYIREGKIQAPQKVYPIGNPDSTWSKYMLNETDIMAIHEFILDSGRSDAVPTKAELMALLKNHMMLYTKTVDGKFVPVWKAE